MHQIMVDEGKGMSNVQTGA